MFDIISFGDYRMLAEAFNGLAMIFNTAAIANMMRMAFLIGILSFGARAVALQRWDATPLLAGLIGYMVLFGPKVTVTVTDGYSGAVRVVANVPIGIAAPMTITSHTGRYFAQTFETAFTVVMPGNSYFQEGYVSALEVLLKMRAPQIGWAAGNVEKTLVNYLKDCVYYDLYLADPASPPEVIADDLMKAPSTWPALKTTFMNVYTTSFLLMTDNQPRHVSCEQSYNELDAGMDTWMATYYDNYLQTLMSPSRQAFSPSAETRIDAALQAINISAGNGRRYMMNTMLQTAMRNAELSAKVGAQDVAGAVMITQGAQQRNARWAAEKSMFEQVSRPITAFIELFMVAGAPFFAIAIAAFGPMGFSLLGKFLMLHVWVSLWAPTMAIVNAYMGYTLAEYVNWTQFDKGVELLSQLGLDQLSAQLQTQYAVGGMLAAAVPMFTLMLITGSSIAATQLASQMRGAQDIDPKIASPDLVQPGPVVSQASTMTQNPGTGTWQTTGAVVPSLSVGTALSSGVERADGRMSSAQASASDAFNRRWGMTESANDRVSFQKDGSITGNGTISRGIAAIYNHARAAALETGASGTQADKYALSMADQHVNGWESTAGGSIGTGDAMPILQLKAGLASKAGASTLNGLQSDTGMTEQQLRAATSRTADTASKDETVRAGYDEGKRRSETYGNAKDYTKGISAESARSIASSIQQVQSATQTYQSLRALRNQFGVNAESSPTGLAVVMQRTFGNDWASRVSQRFGQGYSDSDPDAASKQRADALAATLSSGAFKNSGMSDPDKQAALAMAWTMVRNPTEFPGFVQDMAKGFGANQMGVTSNPSGWGAEVDTSRVPKQDVFKKAEGSGVDAMTSGQGVTDTVTGGLRTRAGAAQSWNRVLANDFSPAAVAAYFKEKGVEVDAADSRFTQMADNARTLYQRANEVDRAAMRESILNANPEKLRSFIDTLGGNIGKKEWSDFFQSRSAPAPAESAPGVWADNPMP